MDNVFAFYMRPKKNVKKKICDDQHEWQNMVFFAVRIQTIDQINKHSFIHSLMVVVVKLLSIFFVCLFVYHEYKPMFQECVCVCMHASSVGSKKKKQQR